MSLSARGRRIVRRRNPRSAAFAGVRFSLPRFRRLFARHDADGDGALDGEALTRLFAENRTDLIGYVGREIY
jgi:hypothetical protein